MRCVDAQPIRRTVWAPDGRVLAVADAGDPDGFPVLVHHGTPNSRHLYGPHAADVAARHLRLIGYDRPGDGGSGVEAGLDHDGHVTLRQNRVGEVHAWLARHGARRGPEGT